MFLCWSVGAISWRSAKQSLVTSSTTAAELVAVYKALTERIWLWNLVTNLRFLKELKDHSSCTVTIRQPLCIPTTIGGL